MGFKKSWDKDSVMSQLAAMYHAMSSPYNDGFIGWGVKQELYEIKWYLDMLMENASTYAPEEEFLKEHEQKKILGILKK